MDARFHHRLAWIVTAVLVAAAGCGEEKVGATGTKPGGKPGEPGRPGGPTMGATAAECIGKSWFGDMEEGPRALLVDLVCADARSGNIVPGHLDGAMGMSCQSAYKARNDAEIAAILTALDEGQVNQAKAGETNAGTPAVRDFAHVIGVAHSRSSDEQKSLLRRLPISPAPNEVSRALEKGFSSEQLTLEAAKGAAFDNELVNREVVQHAHTIELLDALAPQAKNEDIRLSIEKARAIEEAHLELACMVRSNLAGNPPAQPQPKPGEP